MARTAIPVQTTNPYGGKIEDISYTAGDATNDHEFAHPGGDVLVLIKNGSGGSIDTTLVGVASAKTFNRATDVTISTGAGEESVVVVPSSGFDQGSGVVHLDLTTDTSMEFAVVKPTATP